MMPLRWISSISLPPEHFSSDSPTREENEKQKSVMLPCLSNSTTASWKVPFAQLSAASGTIIRGMLRAIKVVLKFQRRSVTWSSSQWKCDTTHKSWSVALASALILMPSRLSGRSPSQAELISESNAVRFASMTFTGMSLAIPLSGLSCTSKARVLSEHKSTRAQMIIFLVMSNI